MNGGILHSRRPSDSVPTGNFGGLPAEAIAMARQMGLGPEDLKQMNSMWKNMDDLSESDPETYRKFTSDILAEGPPGKGGKAKTFIPVPSFVVKTKVAGRAGAKGSTASAKFFINMTSCEAIEPPKDHHGRAMEKHEKRGADGLNIPLLVGEVRTVKSSDLSSTSDQAAFAVDAVFHPWVLTRCDDDNTFKAQVIELAMQWVEQETEHAFDKQWKTIKSKYKGGLSSNDDEGGTDMPVPFPIDRAMLQSDPMDERKEPTQTEQSKVAPSPVSEAACMSTPASLLRAASGNGPGNGSGNGSSFADDATSLHGIAVNTGQSHDLKMPGSSSMGDGASSKKAVGSLIQDITPVPITAGSEGAPRKTTKKKSTAVKKGFLHASQGKEAPRIYDKPSSGDGNKEGTYSRFMSKCKVVDMSSMSDAEQQAAMEKHAGQPSEQTPGTTISGESDLEGSLEGLRAGSGGAEAGKGFEALDKGFLSNNSGSSLYKEGQTKVPSSLGAGHGPDAVFDSLVSGIDPDYADASTPLPDPNHDNAFSSLGSIASVLGGGLTDAGGLFSGLSNVSAPGSETKAKPLRGIDNEVEPVGAALRHSLTVCSSEDGKRTLKVLVELTSGVSSIAEVELQVGERELRLTLATGAPPLSLPLPFAVNGDTTKAKFIKAKATLKITLSEA